MHILSDIFTALVTLVLFLATTALGIWLVKVIIRLLGV